MPGDNGSSWKKWLVISALIILALAVVGLIIWRQPANAQEINTPEQLISTARENLRGYGLSLEAELLGRVESVPEALDLLSSEEEAFFFIKDGEVSSLSVGDAIEEAGEGEWQEEIRAAIADNVSVGDLLYRVDFEIGASHLTISPDGQEFSGVFAYLSRLPITTFALAPPRLEDKCELRVLTRNIFGQPAERITVCVRAYCTSSSVDACELIRIEPRAWWFGNVLPDPEFAPTEGSIVMSFCRGPVKYKWGVGLGAIRTTEYGDFEVENLRMGGTGTIMPELSCT